MARDLVVTVGQPVPKWTVGPPTTRWATKDPVVNTTAGPPRT